MNEELAVRRLTRRAIEVAGYESRREERRIQRARWVPCFVHSRPARCGYCWLMWGEHSGVTMDGSEGLGYVGGVRLDLRRTANELA